MDKFVQLRNEMAQHSFDIFLAGHRQFLHLIWKFASQKELLCLPCSNLKPFLATSMHTLLLCHFESKFSMYVS